MRYLTRGFVTGSIVLLALPVWAEPTEQSNEKGDRPRREEVRERILSEFDKDKDGKLNDDERQKMRDAMRERFGRRGPGERSDRYRSPEGKDRDRDGDRGYRGPDSRRGFRGPAGPPPRLESLFDRFDGDKNESLSRDEFAKLSEFVRHRRPAPPGRPPRGPRGGHSGVDGPPVGGEEFRRHPHPAGPPPEGGDRRSRHDDPGGPPRLDGPSGPPHNSEDNADDAI